MKKYLTACFITTLLCVPSIVGAQTDQVLGGEIWKSAQCEGSTCTFAHLLSLVQDILKYLLFISIPIAAIAFAVAGFRIMTAGDNAGARGEAKDMLFMVLKGFVIMLVAGIIVHTIAGSLLKSDFIFLK